MKLKNALMFVLIEMPFGVCTPASNRALKRASGVKRSLPKPPSSFCSRDRSIPVWEKKEKWRQWREEEWMREDESGRITTYRAWRRSDVLYRALMAGQDMSNQIKSNRSWVESTRRLNVTWRDGVLNPHLFVNVMGRTCMPFNHMKMESVATQLQYSAVQYR